MAAFIGLDPVSCSVELEQALDEKAVSQSAAPHWPKKVREGNLQNSPACTAHSITQPNTSADIPAKMADEVYDGAIGIDLGEKCCAELHLATGRLTRHRHDLLLRRQLRRQQRGNQYGG